MATLRNELKFHISKPSAILLEKRLRGILQKDFHTDDDYSYQIRSLYFDDVTDSSYFDKICGLKDREKFRIRYYNDDLGYIRLEKKSKIGSKTLKSSVLISEDVSKSLLAGSFVQEEGDGELLREFKHAIRHRLLRPVVFVDYRRTVFLYPAGNVRITIDRKLAAAPFRGKLLDTPFISYPVLSDAEVILEVKYDAFLPPFISQVLEDVPKVNQAISKYCKCRDLFLL